MFKAAAYEALIGLEIGQLVVELSCPSRGLVGMVVRAFPGLRGASHLIDAPCADGRPTLGEMKQASLCGLQTRADSVSLDTPPRPPQCAAGVAGPGCRYRYSRYGGLIAFIHPYVELGLSRPELGRCREESDWPAAGVSSAVGGVWVAMGA